MARNERDTPCNPAAPHAGRRKDRKPGYGEAMKDLPSRPIVAPAAGRRLAFLPLAVVIIVAVTHVLAVAALLLLS